MLLIVQAAGGAQVSCLGEVDVDAERPRPGRATASPNVSSPSRLSIVVQSSAAAARVARGRRELAGEAVELDRRRGRRRRRSRRGRRARARELGLDRGPDAARRCRRSADAPAQEGERERAVGDAEVHAVGVADDEAGAAVGDADDVEAERDQRGVLRVAGVRLVLGVEIDRDVRLACTRSRRSDVRKSNSRAWKRPAIASDSVVRDRQVRRGRSSAPGSTGRPSPSPSTSTAKPPGSVGVGPVRARRRVGDGQRRGVGSPVGGLRRRHELARRGVDRERAVRDADREAGQRQRRRRGRAT